MRYRNLLFVAVMMAGATLVVAQPASAARPEAGAPKATGELTCAINGTVSFQPPITVTGTAGYKHQLWVWSLSLSACTGPAGDTPQPSPTAATVVTKDLKIPGTGTGKSASAGSCADLTHYTGMTKKGKAVNLKLNVTWAGGATIKNTKVRIPINSGGNGSSKGSFTGAATWSANVTDFSAFTAVCGTGGSGSLSSLTFDPTMSSLSVGDQVMAIGSGLNL